MSKKKVAIIGIGALGEGMVKVFFEHPLVELVAVCDTNKEKVEQCAALYNVEGFTNHIKLLEKVNIDMVYVAVPPKWHHDIAVDVMRAGKHIICEKPLANSLAEAENMLRIAKEQNVVHAMNFPLNYLHNTRKFEELWLEGYIGKLRKVELTMQFPKWPRHWQQNSWIDTREQGGFVFEVAGHFVQLIQRFFGQISDVESELEFPSDSNLPEVGIIAKMRLANGVPISFNGISGIAGLEEQHLSLTAYGTEGTLSLIDLKKIKAGKIGEEFLEIEVENNHFWNELINQFVDAIDGKTSELYDFQVGYDVQVVLEELRK
ncbi:Gfo/Idh/MocA family protein [Lederbergia wuyishanensis]|uniref:Dehydrogenase n=1 Tax=Lederbergia wuyishanensis TaxID=1347903 RepID=A0ABU0D2V3_9BACI|nr:Gfo/Idh/MocA family oxidoreductase [Lederbergia wuyishanensis]MCJ8007131.1 Gfo/Idh/MocA family oxidoreductase [Lederbergia wuyishanensis]MDQ0342724.1 putative dehydrogenase [Lederbergia wuyishanensis]